ncbi:PEBP-like protein [Microthyrium microscopicum]|uniref:PEBP-like protein n=1 Tax=Microthyrium microscopicum TaxID=703497 RepID=A0A6A6U2W2_9PEZI|nr:PEBP-like protein [Microthyrium microscopicum]
MSQDRTAILHQNKVIPDVLPESTSVEYGLIVEWPNVSIDVPGKELDREATQPEPTLQLNPTPDEKHDDYVLIMADPDLLGENDANFGQVRHWLATGVSVDTSGKVVVPKESAISPYIGPAPLPNYISARPHRYVFILSRPSSSSGQVNISHDDLQALQKDYPALSGSQQSQDLIDRWGFNAQKLLEQKQLKVVAATVMLVGGTLKSAVDNMAMTGQAVFNKATGS